jgi:urate oxidase
MAPALGHNTYGKSGVHLVVVDREAPEHTVTDLTVDIRLEGDFAAAHTDGDNSAVIPTDTMRGTVFAFARSGPVGEPEAFGLRLAHHFVDTVPAVDTATVRLRAQRWARIGGDHPTAFIADTTITRTAEVRVGVDDVQVGGGLTDGAILKTADSAFSGFFTDALTTLAETDDRLLATRMTADWRYLGTDVDWGAAAHQVRDVLLRTFADHHRASIQHTLYAMGEAVLDRCADVGDIHLVLPNVHHLLVDLSRYGLDNDNAVFVATTEPHGVIEATVVRDVT